MKQSKRKKILMLTSILFIPLCIYTILIFINGVDNFFVHLVSLNMKWILSACLFMIINWLSETHVLNIMVKFLYDRQKYRKSLQITMIGQLFNSITPFATGGQPMQLYYLVQSEGMTTGCATSILLLKFVIYQTILTLYSALVLIIKLQYFKQQINNLVLFALLGFLLNSSIIIMCLIFAKNKTISHKIIMLTIKILKKIKILKNTEEFLIKAEVEIENFYTAMILLKQNIKLWISTSLLTIIQLTAFYMIPYCISRGMNLKGDLFNMISAQALVQMIISFIPLPGASGVAEGSFYMFFQLFFTNKTIATALVLWRLITYYSCIAVGCIAMVLPVILVFFAAIKNRKVKNKDER